MGRGTVTILDARTISYTNQAQAQGNEPFSIHNLRLHVLSHGDRYDLKQHQPIPQAET
jgi:cyanophycinase